MNIATKLQRTLDTKAAIKQAIIDMGGTVTNEPFSSYPALIGSLSSGGPPVGTIADYKMNQNAPGWLIADGSAYQKASYPELALLLSHITKDNYNFLQSPMPALMDFSSLGSFRDMKLSPNGRYLAIAHYGTSRVVLIDTTDWTEVADGPQVSGESYKVAFSKDSEYLAYSYKDTNSGTGVAVFNIMTGVTIDTPIAVYGTSTKGGLEFSPDGQFLVVGVSSPYVYRTSDWQEVFYVNDSRTRCYCFSPDSNYFVMSHDTSRGDYLFSVYRTSDWSGISGLPELNASAQRVQYSADGALLYFTKVVSSSVSVQVVDATTWSILSSSPVWSNSGINDVAYSSDTKYLAVVSSYAPRIRIIETSTWTEVPCTQPAGGYFYNVVFGPNDSYLICRDNSPTNSAFYPSKQFAPDGYFYVPELAPKTLGNVTIQPMIKAE